MPACLACLAKSALALRGQRGAGLQQGDGLLVNAKEDRRRAPMYASWSGLRRRECHRRGGLQTATATPEGWPSLTPAYPSLCSSTVLASLPAGAAELTT